MKRLRKLPCPRARRDCPTLPSASSTHPVYHPKSFRTLRMNIPHDAAVSMRLAEKVYHILTKK